MTAKQKLRAPLETPELGARIASNWNSARKPA
jgi:hypothetical protein